MKSKLFSPLALIVQGFAFGAILFFATGTPDNEVPPQVTKVAPADIRSI